MTEEHLIEECQSVLVLNLTILIFHKLKELVPGTKTKNIDLALEKINELAKSSFVVLIMKEAKTIATYNMSNIKTLNYYSNKF